MQVRLGFLPLLKKSRSKELLTSKFELEEKILVVGLRPIKKIKTLSLRQKEFIPHSLVAILKLDNYIFITQMSLDRVISYVEKERYVRKDSSVEYIVDSVHIVLPKSIYSLHS